MEEDLQKAFVSTNQQPALFGRRLLACVIPSLQKFNKADKPSDIQRLETETWVMELGMK